MHSPTVLDKIFVARHFHVLAQFPFTKREAELVYHDGKVNVRAGSRITEQLKSSEIKKFQVRNLKTQEYP